MDFIPTISSWGLLQCAALLFCYDMSRAFNAVLAFDARDFPIISQSFATTVVSVYLRQPRLGHSISPLALFLVFGTVACCLAFRLFESILLKKLTEEETSHLRLVISFFVGPKLFFMYSQTLDPIERTLWISWFLIVLCLNCIGFLSRAKQRRIRSRYTNNTQGFLFSRILCLILQLGILAFLLLSSWALTRTFKEAVWELRLASMDLMVSSCQLGIALGLGTTELIRENSKAFLFVSQTMESILIQGFAAANYVLLWIMHGLVSPMIFPTLYAGYSFFQLVMELSDHFQAVSLINDFPTARGDPVTRENPMCSICRETVPEFEGRQLPCGHCFHDDCLEAWIQVKKECPNCRTPIDLNQEGAEEEPGNAPDDAGDPSVPEQWDDVVERHGFTFCLDLFTLLPPLHIGFVYERQHPRRRRAAPPADPPDEANDPADPAENVDPEVAAEIAEAVERLMAEEPEPQEAPADAEPPQPGFLSGVLPHFSLRYFSDVAAS